MGTSRTNHSKSFGEMGKNIKDAKITNPLQKKVHITRATPKKHQIPGGLSLAGKRNQLAYNFTRVHNTARESAHGF